MKQKEYKKYCDINNYKYVNYQQSKNKIPVFMIKKQ